MKRPVSAPLSPAISPRPSHPPLPWAEGGFGSCHSEKQNANQTNNHQGLLQRGIIYETYIAQFQGKNHVIIARGKVWKEPFILPKNLLAL